MKRAETQRSVTRDGAALRERPKAMTVPMILAALLPHSLRRRHRQ
jgi:Cu/Ag efflux pump CusA